MHKLCFWLVFPSYIASSARGCWRRAEPLCVRVGQARDGVRTGAGGTAEAERLISGGLARRSALTLAFGSQGSALAETTGKLLVAKKPNIDIELEMVQERIRFATPMFDRARAGS
jgi:hypothetical protein